MKDIITVEYNQEGKPHKVETNAYAQKLSDGRKKQLRTLYRIGRPIDEIARIFNITPSQVIHICKHVKRGR